MAPDLPHSQKYSFEKHFWSGPSLSLVSIASKVLCKLLSYPQVLNFPGIPALLGRMECFNFPSQRLLVTLHIEINAAVGGCLVECFLVSGPRSRCRDKDGEAG